ncbi:MAG: DNA polymerase I [Candidatus Aminicenantes bacterium RBG_13_59_9]|nr:MAG: DNA polymerase I [Candidatus Aminicenantes bacterium RBG_13_59_9]
MIEENKRLFLVDGNSILYRSYYAIQRLSNSRGFPTNAVYGFINTLRKLLAEAKPAYLGVVFDTGRPTVRHKAFKAYKAQRKPMPDDLIVQVPVLKEVLRAMRIPCLEYEDYEADDVLGSLAVQAARAKIPAVVVSTDKDLLQLVNDCVTVYNPSKELWLDEPGVRNFFGVAPVQVVDVLSLWGDPSDNIPGVPGVGEKTAKNLINEFGSLDNLLQNLARVKNPRIVRAIEENRDKLEMSRQLVTIEKGLDVPLDLEKFAVSEPDRDALLPLFQELEFTSLLSSYMKEAEPLAKNYTAVLEERALKALAARIRKAGRVSLDTETDSPSPTRARLVGMSFSLEAGEAFYLPLRHDYPGAPKQIPLGAAFRTLGPVLTDPEIRLTGQNIKYDAIVLKREGLELAGVDLDTMVLSYLLEPNWGKHSLDRLALSYLQEKTIAYEEVAGKGKNQVTMNAVPIDRVAPYACQDADFALRLGRLLWPRVEAEKLDKLYRDIEQPLIKLLAQMEVWGVKVDCGALEKLSAEFEDEMCRLRAKIHEMAGTEFNINSPQQLAHILFTKLNMAPSRKTKITRKFSTSIDILQELALIHPLAQHVLEYRQMAKLKSTYADALPLLVNPETGRIHTSYNQTVTATGRLSSSEPNLQNIPARGELGRRFRRAFIPEKGFRLLVADYSQIELRVLAHLSADRALIETFVKDRDVHEETARRVFGEADSLFREEQRRKAKVINFSIIYGTSAFSLAKELCTSNSEAQRFIDRYFEQHPRVRDFLDETVCRAESLGYTETLFGRKRQVPELRQKDRVVQQAGRRIALNAPIQGTAADLMKKAMLDIWDGILAGRLGTRMILQVHDELVFEVPEEERAAAEKLVREKMEGVFPLRVPLKAHLGWGPNWADAK